MLSAKKRRALYSREADRVAMIKIDALVIGLGPAGSAAAAVIARSGARVVALERKREIGVPVQCAELIPQIVAQEAGDVRSTVRQLVDGMHVFVEAEAGDRAPNFPGRMIDRAAFDEKLARDAIAAGAECRLSTSVHSVDGDGKVITNRGEEFSARVIIGADGPHSVVGCAIGRVNTEFAETRQKTVALTSPHTATDIFLSADMQGGYGWLFPKVETANLGVGVAAECKADLKRLLDELHARLVEEGRVGRDALGHTGGSIPVSGLVRPVGRLGACDVFLAGDAAGLTNPITGAGINAAVISGSLAGEAAVLSLAGDQQGVVDYCDEIEALFKPGLDRALRHRKQLLASYESGERPSPDALRRAWIAYDGYWERASEEGIA
jgi:digeranylgeranylglycerophospholipid reductase